jgi:hypothetical protein
MDRGRRPDVISGNSVFLSITIPPDRAFTVIRASSGGARGRLSRSESFREGRAVFARSECRGTGLKETHRGGDGTLAFCARLGVDDFHRDRGCGDHDRGGDRDAGAEPAGSDPLALADDPAVEDQADAAGPADVQVPADQMVEEAPPADTIRRIARWPSYFTPTRSDMIMIWRPSRSRLRPSSICADDLRDAMTDKLVADGWITSLEVEAAFRAGLSSRRPRVAACA